MYFTLFFRHKRTNFFFMHVFSLVCFTCNRKFIYFMYIFLLFHVVVVVVSI